MIDLETVVSEVDGLWAGRTAWLDRQTGRILVLDRGRAGEEFVPLPGLDELPVVERFLSSLASEVKADRLARAYCGPRRGRNERFRAELERQGLLEAWHGYRRAALRRLVASTLDDEGIRYE